MVLVNAKVDLQFMSDAPTRNIKSLECKLSSIQQPIKYAGIQEIGKSHKLNLEVSNTSLATKQ